MHHFRAFTSLLLRLILPSVFAIIGIINAGSVVA